MDKALWMQVGSYIGLVLFGVIVGLSKSLFDWLRKKHSIRQHTTHLRNFHAVSAIDMNIHALLTSCRISQHATRVALLRYHNGDYYIDGSPIQKVTSTHDSVKPGTAPIRIDQSPVSLYTAGLGFLIKEETRIVEVDELPDCRLRRLLESLGTRTIAGIPVMIGEHQMAGVMLVAWDEELSRPADGFHAVAEQTAREVGNEIVRMHASKGK